MAKTDKDETAKTAKSTARKPAGQGAKAKAKPAAKATAKASPAKTGNELRKPALIEAVMAASGLKKPQARAAVEATLAELGRAVSEGREIRLAPFGNAKTKRSNEIDGGKVSILRVVRKSDQG